MPDTDLIARLREHDVRGDSPIANEAADAFTNEANVS